MISKIMYSIFHLQRYTKDPIDSLVIHNARPKKKTCSRHKSAANRAL